MPDGSRLEEQRLVGLATVLATHFLDMAANLMAAHGLSRDVWWRQSHPQDLLDISLDQLHQLTGALHRGDGAFPRAHLSAVIAYSVMAVARAGHLMSVCTACLRPVDGNTALCRECREGGGQGT